MSKPISKITRRTMLLFGIISVTIIATDIITKRIIQSSSVEDTDGDYINDLTEQNRQIAELAWNYFVSGWATGKWQPFLDMLADDFTFWFPEGQFKGRFFGREGKAKITAWVNFL